MITRIVKLPKHDNVLIGRDLAELFTAGHVYEIKKYFGEYVITDIGETALPEDAGSSPNVHSRVDDIMLNGTYCLTKE